jgi:hypothetical protein
LGVKVGGAANTHTVQSRIKIGINLVMAGGSSILASSALKQPTAALWMLDYEFK